MEVWKYPLDLREVWELEMPSGAKLLDVQMQNGAPCLWALVDPWQPPVRRRVGVFGTGHYVPRNVGEHVGTFQLDGGALIFHVFEL